MPELADLVHPNHTALVTQEVQRGVVGDLSALPELAGAARESGALERIATLAGAARAAGVEVVHCVAHHRPDWKGSNTNARLFAAVRKMDGALHEGTDSTDILPELGPEPSDLVLSRYHGLGPMHDSGLDSVLRNLGVTTIVGVGVSVNVGMVDFAFDAVNAGYQFVLPRDAVAGVPADYADAVVDHTLALVTTVTTAGEIVAAWE